MNLYNLNDYLNDLDQLTIYNITENIKDNLDLKNLIFFLINYDIKFYYKEFNEIVIKSKQHISLELIDLKKKTLNNFIIKFIKIINNNSKIHTIKTEITFIFKIIQDIENIIDLLDKNYNKLILIHKKEYNEQNAIEYKS